MKTEIIDRSEVSRSLAKAIAYKCCGKDEEAAEWARRLVTQLQCAEILAPDVSVAAESGRCGYARSLQMDAEDSGRRLSDESAWEKAGKALR